MYGISTLLDAVIFNLIEFWTGDNPISYKNEEGDLIKITKSDDGYFIRNVSTGEQLSVLYNEDDKSVYAISDTERIKVVEYVPNSTEALVYLPNGETQVIDYTHSHMAIKHALSQSIQLARK